MKIKDHDLRQLNEERLQTLLEKNAAALLQLTNRLLDDLKDARERLNQDPSNEGGIKSLIAHKSFGSMAFHRPTDGHSADLEVLGDRLRL